MAYYLQTNGTSDWLQLPSMTFTKIELDAYIEHKTGAYQVYVDGRTGAQFGNFQRRDNNVDEWADSLDSVLVDGVAGVNNTAFVPSNQRINLTLNYDQAFTDNVAIFRYHSSNIFHVKGRIYSIKVWNGSTLQAHYDMSTQTVQDQSGNGYHATLTGGTWVDDGAGGTNATITAVPADVTADAIAPSITTASNVSVSSVIADALADVITPIVGSSTNVTVNAVVVDVTASADSPSVQAIRNIGIDAITGDAVADALAPFVGSSQSAEITAVIASVTVDAINPSISTTQGTSINAVISDANSEAISPTIQTDAVISAFAAELQAMANAPSLNAKVIIGVIELNGKRELYVYLVGKSEMTVSLKGGL